MHVHDSKHTCAWKITIYTRTYYTYTHTTHSPTHWLTRTYAQEETLQTMHIYTYYTLTHALTYSHIRTGGDASDYAHIHILHTHPRTDSLVHAHRRRRSRLCTYTHTTHSPTHWLTRTYAQEEMLQTMLQARKLARKVSRNADKVACQIQNSWCMRAGLNVCVTKKVFVDHINICIYMYIIYAYIILTILCLGWTVAENFVFFSRVFYCNIVDIVRIPVRVYRPIYFDSKRDPQVSCTYIHTHII